jgi:hypothetical protein
MGQFKFEMNANNSIDYNAFSNHGLSILRHSFSNMSYDGVRSTKNVDVSTLSVLNDQRHKPTVFANKDIKSLQGIL